MEATGLFKIFSSSAGSGKTFTLAIEYIKLLLINDEHDYFRKILAVTFTNDAVNEMKSRILEYLELLSNPNQPSESLLEKRNFLLKIIEKDFKKNGLTIDNESIENKSKKALMSIIHHYSDFSVSTIDSFVQKIVSAFAIQLGYLNNIEIALDAEEILLPAAENFISKVGQETEASLTEAIIEYVNQLADDGKSWNNLPKSFANFANNLFSDSKIAYLQKIENLPLNSIKEISKQIIDYLNKTELAIKNITSDFIDICKKNDLNIEDFYYSGKGILAAFCKRNKGIDIFKEFNSYVQNAHNDIWYSAKSKKKDEIDNVKGELLGLLCQYEEIIEAQKSKYILLKAIYKNLFKLSLLRQFKTEIENIQSDTGMVHISEFNKAILNVVSSEPVPYIYERIGEKYSHIMIDEFQDTSPIQFQNFLPLFANSLANNKFCMVVGDPKQAIYRFRGGDMTQILHLYNNQLNTLKKGLNPDSFLIDNIDQLPPHLFSENLKVNYRSCAEIIDFNNELFGFVRSHEPFLNEFNMLDQAYDENYFQQKPLNVKSGAHIEIHFKKEKAKDKNLEINENESENYDDDAIEKSAEMEVLKTIQNCISEGFEYKDIAILCRSKNTAKIIANDLKINGIPIISADSILLYFSNSINFIIDFFEIISNNNQLVRYKILCHFHQYLLHTEIPALEGNIKQMVDNEDIKCLIDYFNKFGFGIDGAMITILPIYELAEYLIGSFNLFENKAEQDYLLAFLDEINNFKNQKSNNIQSFLDYWEKNKDRLSILGSENEAITITTIHKSKGLQYPIVIIPSANWGFNISLKDSVWVHLDEVSFPELSGKQSNHALPVASLGPNNNLKETPIKEQYRAEEELYFLEAINMLYVATTRAEKRIYIFSEKQINQMKLDEYKEDLQFKKAPTLIKVGDILLHFLFQKGEIVADKYEYILKQGDKQIENKIGQKPLSIPIANNNYSIENRPKIKVSETQYDQNSIDYGNKMHAILANIFEKKNVELAVKKAVTNGSLQQKDSQDMCKKLNKILSLTEISDYFESGLFIKNEMEIILPNGSTQKPDRVVFLPETTVIIDYKTGKEKPEYNNQLKAYGALLKDMGYPKPLLYLVYLEQAKAEEVY